MHPAQSFTCLATVGQEYLGSTTQVSDSCFPTDATVLGGECKWLEAQGAEGQQQTSVRRSGVQRSGIIDRSPVLHVYASVAEIELFTKFRIRLFDDYEIQSHSVGVDKHSVLSSTTPCISGFLQYVLNGITITHVMMGMLRL